MGVDLKRGETCQRQILMWPCGESVTTVFVHKTDKTDVNRMCTACANAIRDTGDYDRYDLIPKPRKRVSAT